jgi:hypothetical protein
MTPPPRLILIGTVHLDPAGYPRLRARLETLKPDTISVEVSPFAVAFRREHTPRFLRRLDPLRRDDGSLPPGLEPVAAQLDLPFEFRAARDVMQARPGGSGRQPHLLGDSDESRHLLGLLEQELLAPDNLARLARAPDPPLARLVRAEWQRARREHNRPPVLGTEALRRLQARESRLAAGIRDHLRGVTVHIGGWRHLHGLQQQLSDLSPTTELLTP